MYVEDSDNQKGIILTASNLDAELKESSVKPRAEKYAARRKIEDYIEQKRLEEQIFEYEL